MGNHKSKNAKSLLDEQQNLGKYSCRVKKDYDNQIQLNPKHMKCQFGNRYLYFPLPKDFLKNDFSRISLLYQNFSIFTNNTDSCLIIKKEITPTRNKIDNIQYIEYSALSDKKCKFSVRINQYDINKSQIVYCCSIEQ